MHVTLTIPIGCDVKLARDGSVARVDAPTDQKVLIALVEKEHPLDERIARVAHATRCRLDENLVRVWFQGYRGCSEVMYRPYGRVTKQHVELMRSGGKAEKWRLRNGTRVGGNLDPQIDADDLKALRLLVPK